MHLQEERPPEGRAAALEDSHGERSGGRLEGEAQAGGRGFMEGFDGPPERDEGAPGFGGDGEAAQLRVARTRQPGEQRMAARRAQHLLGGPERIAPAGRPDHGELGEVDPRGGQRRRIRQVRR